MEITYNNIFSREINIPEKANIFKKKERKVLTNNPNCIKLRTQKIFEEKDNMKEIDLDIKKNLINRKKLDEKDCEICYETVTYYIKCNKCSICICYRCFITILYENILIPTCTSCKIHFTDSFIKENFNPNFLETRYRDLSTKRYFEQEMSNINIISKVISRIKFKNIFNEPKSYPHDCIDDYNEYYTPYIEEIKFNNYIRFLYGEPYVNVLLFKDNDNDYTERIIDSNKIFSSNYVYLADLTDILKIFKNIFKYKNEKKYLVFDGLKYSDFSGRPSRIDVYPNTEEISSTNQQWNYYHEYTKTIYLKYKFKNYIECLRCFAEKYIFTYNIYTVTINRDNVYDYFLFFIIINTNLNILKKIPEKFWLLSIVKNFISKYYTKNKIFMTDIKKFGSAEAKLDKFIKNYMEVYNYTPETIPFKELSLKKDTSNIVMVEEIKNCFKENCSGVLVKMKCSFCETKFCKRCEAPKPENKKEKHVCDPNIISSLQLIKKDSKKCPNCKSIIYKISGCSQMWCTNCNTSFDWNTLTIIKDRRFFHNIHYTEHLRNTNATGYQNNNTQTISIEERNKYYINKYNKITTINFHEFEKLFETYDNEFNGDLNGTDLINPCNNVLNIWFYSNQNNFIFNTIIETLSKNFILKDSKLHFNDITTYFTYVFELSTLLTHNIENMKRNSIRKFNGELENIRVNFVMNKILKEEFARKIYLLREKLKKNTKRFELRETFGLMFTDFCINIEIERRKLVAHLRKKYGYFRFDSIKIEPNIIKEECQNFHNFIQEVIYNFENSVDEFKKLCITESFKMEIKIPTIIKGKMTPPSFNDNNSNSYSIATLK